VPELQLITIRCVEQEDQWGADSLVLRVRDDSVWDGELEEGETASLDHVNPISFTDNVKLTLEELDSHPDPDDDLGTVYVDESESGQGERQAEFDRDDAMYFVEYEVLA
jgi:hypothetical protein